jgi:hypothetical protein
LGIGQAQQPTATTLTIALREIRKQMTAHPGDGLALGRDLIARGLGAPMLIVADCAPG